MGEESAPATSLFHDSEENDSARKIKKIIAINPSYKLLFTNCFYSVLIAAIFGFMEILFNSIKKWKYHNFRMLYSRISRSKILIFIV